ncbi:MAG: ABC transporter ATP-binding protein [Sphingobacteriaceae bacterium]|nr:ABC transporter ATP-binding protein [Sphingobacteriaceae bacterium]
MKNESVISIKQAGFGYRSRSDYFVLKDVNLILNKGELTGIIGLNGSGKSTFIKSVCGLHKALTGEVEVYSQNIYSLDVNERSKLVSVVLTERNSGFNLTCLDVVRMGRIPFTNMFGKLTGTDNEIVDNCVKHLGLEEHKSKLLEELSDGLYQKTMIARCMAQQTSIMLLDEPAAFLDYGAKHDLFKHLRDLCVIQQKCILFSSHELDLILKYCTNVLILHNSTAQLIPVNEAMNHKYFKEVSGGYI